jgi:hypothetical protein
MPSVITGIIGGIQGSSAAHDAADAQSRGYTQATNDVTQAVSQANPIIQGSASLASGDVTNKASAAATGMDNAMWGGNIELSPYRNNGHTASDNLSNLTSAGFSFNPSNLESTPGYQFALEQGLKGVSNTMAARGLGGSGAEMKAGANYAANLAQSTYQQAFNNALSTYNTNVTSLLPQASMGLTAANLTAGNLMEAARYSGNTNLAGSEYAGNAGMWSGGHRASNLLNAGVYAGNAAANSGNAQAQGHINAANAWNGALQSVGNGLNPLALAGFGSGGGWSIGNIGPNLGSIWG